MSDYIKRKDALAYPFANGNFDRKNASEDFILGCESYRDWLENLPAANVREKVNGLWIHHEYDWLGDYWECSVCHEEYASSDGDMDCDFCPGCGANMRKVVKTDEQQ